MATLKFQAEEVDTDDEDFLEIELNGKSFKAFRPTEGQIILVIDAMGNERNGAFEQVSGFTNFLRDTLEPEGYTIVRDLLANPRVKNATEVMQDIIEAIVEYFADDPSTSSSGSSSSQPASGGRSTASTPKPASTRSRSGRAASTTSSTRRS